MATPLYDGLKTLAGAGTARFHMPGHKGQAVHPALAGPALDFTELSGTGDLYRGRDDVIAQAEALWAQAVGFGACQFLTGGATQGLHAALLLAARRGRRVLVDRAAHRAVWNGMALWDMLPTSLPRRQDRPVDPAAVEAALLAQPEIKTVCITSPTYYGVLSDIAAIARVVHAHGGLLLVDGAHGAHLPFLEEAPFQGTDLLVTSPHKTLPVYGQGALLFARREEGEALRWAASVTGTSSPSYLVMASLDGARAWLTEGPGRACLKEAAAFVARCRGRFPALTGPGLDPTRLTLLAPGGGLALAEGLEAAGIGLEMADRDHLVAIVTGCEPPGDPERLWQALEGVDWPRGAADDSLPPLGEQAVTPRQALLGRRSRLPLDQAVGRIAAQGVCPYPPGVPVVAPGERVTKKALAYLAEMGYNLHIPLEIWESDPEEPGPARREGGVST